MHWQQAIALKGHTNLEAAISNAVNLGIDECAIVFHELEGVAGIAVHVVITVGYPAVRKQYHDLMRRFWVLRQVVLLR
jgi:hypothetical protein